MSAKNLTLYCLPYVVTVASILVAAQEVAPPIAPFSVSNTITIRQTIPSQTVNRALKQDKLLLHPSTVHQIVVEPATG
jgi:hypothetical protein